MYSESILLQNNCPLYNYSAEHIHIYSYSFGNTQLFQHLGIHSLSNIRLNVCTTISDCSLCTFSIRGRQPFPFYSDTVNSGINWCILGNGMEWLISNAITMPASRATIILTITVGFFCGVLTYSVHAFCCLSIVDVSTLHVITLVMHVSQFLYRCICVSTICHSFLYQCVWLDIIGSESSCLHITSHGLLFQIIQLHSISIQPCFISGSSNHIHSTVPHIVHLWAHLSTVSYRLVAMNNKVTCWWEANCKES